MNDNAEHMMFILGQTAKSYGMMILAQRLSARQGKTTEELDEQLKDYLNALDGQIDIFIQMTTQKENNNED